MINKSYKEAAQVVANSPGNLLRNKDTIEKFRAIPREPNKPYPLIQYFFTLLETTVLNKIESLEICGVVLNQNRKQFISEWVSKNKLTFTEELGDLVAPYDKTIALEIYKKAKQPKAVQLTMETGNIQDAMALGNQLGTNIDFLSTIKTTVVTNPAGALQIAQNLTRQGKLQPTKVAEVFMQQGKAQELVTYCLEFLT